MNKLFFILFFTTFILSCSSDNKSIVIASVNNKELLKEDLLTEMPKQLEDSTYFVEKFINDWIRKELLLSNAEMNLSAELVYYEKQIEEYRASLLIYAYQQELINQNFDSTVSFNDINDYYQLYKNEFILAKNIFKGRFIIIDKSAPNLKFLNNIYKSSNESNIIELEDYCQQFAKEYYTNVESWNFFSAINNKLPSFIKDEESFLINTDGVFFEDELYRYYIYIEEFITKGNVSPLEVVNDKIRVYLLNKKKVIYLKQLEDDLYQIALTKKKINIY